MRQVRQRLESVLPAPRRRTCARVALRGGRRCRRTSTTAIPQHRDERGRDMPEDARIVPRQPQHPVTAAHLPTISRF